MIRLSKKAWNNVLIFSMLLMIFLFNGLHHKLIDSDEEVRTQHLLPQQSYILKLAYPDVTIERIGTGWRSSAAVSESELIALVQRWKQTLGMTFPDTTTAEKLTAGKSPEKLISIWLAGETKPLTLAFFAQDEYFLVYSQLTSVWLKVTAEDLVKLFNFN